MAISIQAIREYWELLLVVAIVGAFTTYFFTIWLGRRMFLNNTTHYILAMFGMLTGTATAWPSLEGIDPDLKTDVAKNLVLGSAVAAPLGFPLMAILGMPIIGFTTGNPVYSYITFIAILLYMSLLIGIGIIKTRRENLDLQRNRYRIQLKKLPFEHYIRIDNRHLGPDVVARKIKGVLVWKTRKADKNKSINV